MQREAGNNLQTKNETEIDETRHFTYQMLTKKVGILSHNCTCTLWSFSRLKYSLMMTPRNLNYDVKYLKVITHSKQAVVNILLDIVSKIFEFFPFEITS